MTNQLVKRIAALVVSCLFQSIPLLADAILITAPKTVGPTDTTIVATAGGPVVPLAQADIRVVGTTLTINGRHAINSLSVERSAGNVAGVVTHAAGFNYDYSNGAGTDIVFGLWLDVAGDATIEGADGALVASRMDANGRGFAGSQGPGGPPIVGCCGGGGGAAHAGNAGNGREFTGSTATYGSATQPVQLGSGGQNVWWSDVGGFGGGAARLTIGGTLTVDGQVRSDGANGVGGGSTSGGGGSGGSIWIEALALKGSGVISANGGAGVNGIAGGGGGGRIAIYCNSSTFVGAARSLGGGIVGRQGGAGTVYFALGNSRPVLRIDNEGIAGATTDINEPLVLDADLEVGPGARVSHGTGRETGLSLDFAGDVTVEVGGSIDTTARGYAASQGPGSVPGGGCCGGGGGAAHGGNAGNGREFAGATSTYGSVTQPSQLGSGGQNVWGYNVGGYGGGAMHLAVGGALTVDGSMQSNGSAGTGGGSTHGGGGSGGSILIEASVLHGSGTISVNGGTGVSDIAGGGGGGRVAIYCSANNFVGVIASVGGGFVGRQGGAGTVYVARTGSLPVLRIDNGGIVGATTDVNEPLVLDADLEVGPGARVSHGTGRVTGLSLDFAGDVTVEVGGSINTTARGYSSSNGPGGPPHEGCCGGASGASYGGLGGEGRDHKSVRAGYGSVSRPIDLGSGGQDLWGCAIGGYGGGAIHLRAGGTLIADGTIQSNGAVGIWGCTWVYGGGGSGGSVWIEAGAINGTSTISANGGSGFSDLGGGGSGGRIAIYTCNLLLPSANIVSSGGGGYRLGQNGTIHYGAEGMIISEQTNSVAVCPTGTAVLSVTAAGSGPFAYQWQWKEVGASWKDVVEGLNLDSFGMASFAATDPSLATLSVDPVYSATATVGTIETMRCVAAGACGFLISDVIPFTFCVADFNCDGQVEDADFVVFVQGYDVLACDDPTMPADCPADLNGDGLVDDSDFVLFLQAYNQLGCL